MPAAETEPVAATDEKPETADEAEKKGADADAAGEPVEGAKEE